ncbi:galactose mutarotase [Oceanobacillus piezotolerans]|uniref:Aldose 1-epimerase n=1 Tax=Oceanobacillus piezotolerans TaxID=2448030 RepID=A0A498DBI1_9BACI|nr:aldose epimerase family protein [Oceanobacillus piezotolerans]RLL47044.1 galactose mutarotase [Oceanobacillus piezotolerans]
MNIEIKQLDEKWKTFILRNDHGMEVHILNLGGIIQKIIVPNKHGDFENVVLGYDNYQEYRTDPYFFGAIIGRVAGRIEGASFEINGKKYELERNDATNHLHSGEGFHRVFWDAEPFETSNGVGVKLSYFSKDGENGYPGNLKVNVTYVVKNDNQLVIDYLATTDETTPLTLTNHTYFNLSGNLKDTIEHHSVRINSNNYLELNNELIPTGKMLDTKNTPFDFSRGRILNEGITSDSEQNKVVGNGYDHYFLFDKNEKGNIEVKDEVSGRVLKIQTNQPGVVMYTSNNLEEGCELSGGVSKKYLGVCLETQASPASLHSKGLPSILLNKDEVYNKQTVFTFQVN